MSQEWLERDDLGVFVIAGAPKGFNRRLKTFLHKELGDESESLRLKDDLADWILARVKGSYRRGTQTSPASEALWRAFRALAAAKYHLRGYEDREATIRRLRDEVEECWLETSPIHANGNGS